MASTAASSACRSAAARAAVRSPAATPPPPLLFGGPAPAAPEGPGAVAGVTGAEPDATAVRSRASAATTNQREASTELYSGAEPASGKRFGSMPADTARDQATRIAAA